jgi:hypothetical protein
VDVPSPLFPELSRSTGTATRKALSILNCLLFLSGALSNNWLLCFKVQSYSTTNSQSVCLGDFCCQSQSHFTADCRSVSMFWCRSHFVYVWPDTVFFSRVWILNLMSCLCGAPSLTTGRVCHFVSHSLVICLCVHLLFTFCLSHTHTHARARAHACIYIYIYILYNTYIYTLQYI